MKYLITAIIILQSILVFTQKWDQTYGSSNKDEVFQEVIECYDKGYLLSGAKDIFPYPNLLIKTDINGSVMWERTIQHDDFSITKGAISQNSTGELAITRCLNFPNGNQWPSVIKLDSCGNKLWCRVYIDDEYSHGWFDDVILFDNGDVLALGFLFTDANYNERIFLYYIDNYGNLIWRKSYASKEDHPLVLERIGTSINNVNNGYLINGWCYYPYPGNPGTGYRRPFFIGIDNDFEEKWILPFGVSDSIIGNSYNVIPLNDSIYMGVGYVWETGEDQNTILMFFNNDGEELGVNQIYNSAIGPDINDNITVDIARLNDTLYITSTLFGPEAGLNAYGEFIIDTAANIYKIEQRPNTRGTSTMIKTYDDKFVIGCNYKHPNSDYDIYLYKINDSLQMDTIYPGNYTYDSLCPYQIQSGIIDITDCLLVTDVGETPTPQEYFSSLNTIPIKAYPNPANGNQIAFQYLNTERHHNMELRCFNVFGKLVHEEKVYQYQGESKVNIVNWKPGIYAALVFSDGKVVGQTKFVVQ